ncbi:MAG TPA: hypothetical protein VLX91_09730 [Candidatus Acidoferrales bacterium]|nr:hypothetical protein [Candidatus Acidoferrales bacterium]
MNKLVIVLDIVLVAMVGYFTWFMSTDYQTFHGRYHMPFVLWIIDTVDLFIHEGGHFFFGFMGQMIYFMGGSLMQIVLPSLAIYVFLRSSLRSLIGTLYWLGHNLINVSVYIGDAPYRRLPLISDSAIHDWNWIFNRAGMMDSAEMISSVVLALGIISCCGATATAVYFLAHDFREVVVSSNEIPGRPE